MKFVSHRGAAGLSAENSKEAIEIGASYQPAYIEVDVNRTRDGVFVLYHGNLRKTYTGGGLQETYQTLKKRIPSLLTVEEFIKIQTDVPFLIDIKVKNHYKDLFEILKTAPTYFYSAFTSPHIRPLAAAKDYFPGAKIFISQPYVEGPFRTIELARKYGFGAISLNKWWLGPITYWMVIHYKLDIMVYTVDRTLTMRLIHRFFPKVLICTNHPERLGRLNEKLASEVL